MRSALICVLCSISTTAIGESHPRIRESLRFHVSFDKTADADTAGGDKRAYTAQTLQREKVQPGLQRAALRLAPQSGRYGGGLEFTGKTAELLFYRGAGNLPSRQGGFSGTFCLWLRVAPNSQLPDGFVDPLQITDKKWNNASFFVDFTKDKPRQFRLGVFSDYEFWNPKDRKLEQIPDAERPLIGVDNPPFRRDAWTHVAVTFKDFNKTDKSGVATLFLNGKAVGTLRRPQQFTWGTERLAIMLGINYVGQLDDLAIFDRTLTVGEIETILKLPEGIRSLGP
ncbi:MAG: LamG-like jellyroll fold domain-containing protein [Planctomycetota bacterium]|nr:LamG-like jellyroll fold domain-containing protein [Planctomycetota bacterium]